MSCTHRPDDHFPGESCIRADEVRPGDRIAVLGGAALAVVRDARPHTEPGWTALLLDTPADGPAVLESGTLLPVRRPEPEPDPEPLDDEPEVSVTVELTVTEEVEYVFTTRVEVPASIAADDEALRDHLAEDEELWLDGLDPSGGKGIYLSVNERSLDAARVVLAA
ncbi:hypothetical protein ACH4PU_35945 [Streptomyces sp. NPDC021100]|uniref:hypothetical protein n=1 Tax=Streptomyces sp. NPDC021100 TaxID=3365114 RepID=UPI0037AAD4FF